MKEISVYPCLMAQMYLKGYDSKQLAEAVGLSYVTLRRRLRGESSMKLTEARRIREALNCALPLEILFQRRGERHEA